MCIRDSGYADAWVEEAEKRGLPNIKSMVEAIPALTTEASVRMFEAFNVFTKAELESRVEIEYEAYKMCIRDRSIGDFPANIGQSECR